MRLNCICGRAGSGKSRYVSWQVKQAMDAGMQAYLVVPDQYTLQAERELIRHIGAPGLMSAEVLSFTRLADRVLDTAGGASMPYINPRGRAMAISRLLLEHGDGLKAYGAYTRSPGFAAQLATEISEFKRFDISPAQLSEAADSPQLYDICLIYEKYMEEICSRYIDSEDRMDMMIEKVPKADFLHGSSIFIDGFEMLTSQIYRLVDTLLQSCAQLNITFRLGGENDMDAPIFQTERKHLNRVLSIAKEAGAEYEVTRLPQPGPWGGARHQKNQLTHLECNLYALPFLRYDGGDDGGDDGGVEICLAEGMEKEISLCAVRMRSLAMDGYRWRDMMLVCNDIGQYTAIIKRTFAQYGIPCFIDDKRGVNTHTFARFCIQSLACIHSGYSRNDVLALMKTGFSALDKQGCDRLENLCIINNARWLNPSYSAPVEGDEFHELKTALLDDIYALADKLGKRATAGEMAVAFYEYLESSGGMERFQLFIDGLEAQDDFDSAEVAVQVHRAVCSVLQQAHDLMGDVACDVAAFCGILAAGLEAEEAGIIPSTIDSVFCGSLERSRAGDIQAMFIVGINDGILPGNIFASGLINERQMEQLDEKGIYLGHNSEERACEQELAIYTAVSKPSSFLHLSCSLAGADGKPITPYPLLKDIQERLPDAHISTPVNRGVEHSIGSYTSTRLPLAHAMRNHRYGRRADARWAEVYSAFVQSGQPVPDFSRTGDYIGNTLARRLYGNHMHASASRLESFMQCPFRYFVDYALKPVEKPEYGHNQLDSGNYYHDALQRFVETVSDWDALDDAAIDAAMDGICNSLEEGLLAAQYEGDGREQLNARSMRDNAKGAARAVVQQMQRGKFRPVKAEMDFTHRVQLEGGEVVEIKGRIDRLDEYESGDGKYFRIVDYKSGMAGFDYTALYYGSSIQLPLYAAAIEEAMGAAPAGMFIMHIKEGIPDIADSKDLASQRLAAHKLNGVLLSDMDIVTAMGGSTGFNDVVPAYLTTKGEIDKRGSTAEGWQMRRIIDRGLEHTREAAEGIYAGDSRAYPFTGKLNSCQYCGYRAQCGYGQGSESRPTVNVSKEESLGGDGDD